MNFLLFLASTTGIIVTICIIAAILFIGVSIPAIDFKVILFPQPEGPQNRALTWLGNKGLCNFLFFLVSTFFIGNFVFCWTNIFFIINKNEETLYV